jgi:biotin transport system ATP-binding protein
MIDVEGVRHRFGDLIALDDVTLTLRERRIALIGANGSGKSTFARLLNGLIIPDEGRVLVDRLDTRHDAKAVRRRVGFVFQDPDNQIVMPTVAEDLAFGLRPLRLSAAARQARVEAALARFGLEGYGERSPYLLSAGEKQLLAIASVLITEPAYVVFDEPTTLLDLRNKRRIAAVIAALEHPVVVVSHDLELLRDFDRVIVFDRGRVVADDAPAAAIAFYLKLLDE